jgi:hypothetical protein
MIGIDNWLTRDKGTERGRTAFSRLPYNNGMAKIMRIGG